jgi:cytochrome bd-type quinol oxidase subunit 2
MGAWYKIKHSFARTNRRTFLIYLLLYLIAGLLMNLIGQQLEIARFGNWWQVITSYLIYMVPISIVLRGMPWHAQYAYGLVAMGLLEFAGYALGTSYIYPENVLEHYFGPHTFALAMSLFFAWYIPLGNWAVAKLDSAMTGKRQGETG